MEELNKENQSRIDNTIKKIKNGEIGIDHNSPISDLIDELETDELKTYFTNKVIETGNIDLIYALAVDYYNTNSFNKYDRELLFDYMLKIEDIEKRSKFVCNVDWLTIEQRNELCKNFDCLNEKLDEEFNNQCNFDK